MVMKKLIYRLEADYPTGPSTCVKQIQNQADICGTYSNQYVQRTIPCYGLGPKTFVDWGIEDTSTGRLVRDDVGSVDALEQLRDLTDNTLSRDRFRHDGQYEADHGRTPVQVFREAREAFGHRVLFPLDLHRHHVRATAHWRSRANHLRRPPVEGRA